MFVDVHSCADLVPMSDTRHFRLALCSLGSRSETWVRIVLPRAQSERLIFAAIVGPDFESCDGAIVDFDLPESVAAFAAVRLQNPAIPAIYLSESGEAGFGPFRLARKTLLFKLAGVLGQLVPLPPSAPPQVGAPVVGGPFLAASAGRGSRPIVPQPLAPRLQALVVDDSLAVRAQLIAALEALGFHVKGAGTAEEMRAFEPLSRFDIVFLDVVLPGRDGYAICRELRADPQTDHLPIVMLTSRNAPFDRARGALAGCDLYLTKPVQRSQFHQAVEKALMKAVQNDPGRALARGYKPPTPLPRRPSAEG
jgi:two-component system, cell cycle response regulator